MATTNPYKTWRTDTLIETQSNYLHAMTHYNIEEKKTPAYAILKKRESAMATEIESRGLLNIGVATPRWIKLSHNFLTKNYKHKIITKD